MKEYLITYKFERDNAKGKVEQSERTYQGFHANKKEALKSAKERFEDNEPTARKIKVTCKEIK